MNKVKNNDSTNDVITNKNHDNECDSQFKFMLCLPEIKRQVS